MSTKRRFSEFKTAALVAGLFTALNVLPFQAKAVPPPQDLEVTRPPNYASNGRLSIVQFATLDDKKFQAEWAKQTPGVNIDAATHMRPNQTIFTFISFKGCTPDHSGKCNVTVDFEVFDPTGKSIGQKKDNPVWVNLPPAPNNNLLVSSSSLGFAVDDKDPFGPYKIKAVVFDHVAGVSLRTEQTLTAVAN